VIDQDILIQCVTEATSEVFMTMLGMEVEFKGIGSGGEEAENGLISLIGITGAWGGAGVFCCSPVLARIVWARMLGTDAPAGDASIDEEVMDVVAEVTNMVVGNIKNGLEPVTGPLAIGVPTVIHGRNFQFRNTVGLEYANLSFVTEGEVFVVRVSLAPTTGRPGTRGRTPALGLAHM
jgi:chemotaxis protein CheX